MAMSEKTRTVLNYLKENDGVDMTAADISEALGGDDAGYSRKAVDGIVTSGLQRKGLSERIPAEIEVTDDEGKVSHKTVKFIKLTDAGRDFDPDAEVAAE